MSVLAVNNVSKFFQKETGFARLLSRNTTQIKAVNGVDFEIKEGSITGLVGESGCGKTTLGKLILRVHDLTDGEILLNGRAIDDYGRKEFYREVQMVFQNPFTSLNPRRKVGNQIKEILKIHNIEDRDRLLIDALEFSQLTPPEAFIEKYPHQLSGGEKQRVSIASALVLDPSLIVVDEPVSMLDVSIRAGILDLLDRLAEERDTAILYISHDLASVRHISDELVVMYLGKVMEKGATEDLIESPRHPYTKTLIQATPIPDPMVERERVVRNEQIPDPVDLPAGCFYKDRCEFAVDACDQEDMHLRSVDGAQATNRVACHRADDIQL